MNEMIEVARSAIESTFDQGKFIPKPLSQDSPRGVFVTLWSPGKMLRGCIGHIEPQTGSLAQEIADCAVAAATQDPRFEPLQKDEYESIEVELSLLNPSEPIESVDELDPKRFGVIVSSGYRRGLLLPDIEGVDSAEEQVDIARQKAGIPEGEPYQLERFEVTKVHESR